MWAWRVWCVCFLAVPLLRLSYPTQNVSFLVPITRSPPRKGLHFGKTLPVWLVECRQQHLSPHSFECLGATHFHVHVHAHLYLQSLGPNHRRNSTVPRATVLKPFPQDVRWCQTALPHLKKTPAPPTRYHHSKADQMNRLNPSAGLITRVAVRVSIYDDRSDGDFGTKSVEGIMLEVIFVCEFLASHTWTSFSPSETRFTILVRAALSGLAFRWYSDSSTAWSSGL